MSDELRKALEALRGEALALARDDPDGYGAAHRIGVLAGKIEALASSPASSPPLITANPCLAAPCDFDSGKCPRCGNAPGWRAVRPWSPISEAPLDGTMLWLLVDYSNGGAPLEDAQICATIGFNSRDTSGEDEWKFVGWSFEQGGFCQGSGEVLGFQYIGFDLDHDEAPPAFLAALSPATLTGGQ